MTLIEETRSGMASWTDLTLPPVSAVVVAFEEAGLFADDFESGTPSAWSVHPELPEGDSRSR